MWSFLTRVLQIVIPACVFSAILIAQAVTGTIFGNVTDSSGGAVAGAAIRATNTKTGEERSTAANAQGSYLFSLLSVGEYRIEGESQGFKKSVRDGITVGVNQNARVDFKLEIGSLTQEVRVTGDAPLVDTRDAQLGGTVDNKRIVDLPLNGRNVYSLVSILPGVSRATVNTTADNQGNFISVNGSRLRQTNFLLDGGSNNSFFRNGGNQAPNPDAVQEFRLLTSNFDSEYGRLSGAVVNVVTRAGTNALHGTLFEFLRNNVLNARNFFQPTVAALRQNQFGATAGGPIIRNKTFVFGAWQGLRIRNAAFINAGITPTVAQRAGDLSNFTGNARPVDPRTGQLFPGGIIPQDRLDPVAQNILKLVALPNTPDGRVQANGSLVNNEDQGTLRIDHEINSAHRLFGSLFLIRGAGVDPFAANTQIPNYGIVNNAYDQRNIVINEVWIASPSVLNEARYSYSFSNYATGSPFTTSWPDFGSKVGIGATPNRLPQIFVNGFWQMGTFGEGYNKQKSWGASDTIRWTRNNHSIKFGGGVLSKGTDGQSNWLGSGQIRFTGSVTKNALADFLLGHANSFRQNNSLGTQFSSYYFYGFAQDDWKVSRRLTLNLGLRYEVDQPLVNGPNPLQTFQFGARSKLIPGAPLGMVFSGDPGVPEGIFPTPWKNWAPRVGFAWDVFGDGKTAIRGGYGIFYSGIISNIFGNFNGQPYQVDVTAFQTPNLVEPWANAGGNPFPYKLDPANPKFTLPITASYLGENAGTPYVQQYNFTLQRQLTAVWGLQAAYVGNASRKLLLQRDANAPVYIPGRSTVGNVNDRRPYMPGVFGQIAQSQTGASAHYDSLQVSLNRRFSRGLTVSANYTWSRAIDITSDDQLNPTIVSFVDSNNLRLDRGLSDLTTPHRLVVSWLWTPPQTTRFGQFGKQVINGWQFNGITDLRSGNPLSVLSGVDTNVDGNNTDRPDVIADPKLDGGRSRSELIARFFDITAFRAAAGPYGSAGRNTLYGPKAVNTDFSAFKRFPVTEGRNLELRAEFFNLFNQVNFGAPNTTLTSPNFGRILSAGQPRIVQFGMKFLF